MYQHHSGGGFVNAQRNNNYASNGNNNSNPMDMKQKTDKSCKKVKSKVVTKIQMVKNTVNRKESENKSAGKSKIKENSTMKQSVKRRIDFSKEEENPKKSKVISKRFGKGVQCNNNATQAKMQTRSSLIDGKAVNEAIPMRVQWTKEFMDKVRESNKKHQRLEKDDKALKLLKPVVNQKFLGKLQGDKDETESNVSQLEGDRIITTVADQMSDVEDEDLLDYEDDLSIDNRDDEVNQEGKCFSYSS